VATTVLPLDKILSLISGPCFEILRQPAFSSQSQSSFDRDISIKNIPVLINLKDGGYGMRYSGSKLRGNTEAAAAALAELRAAINTFDSSYSATLNPGDILLINNQICLHGRSANTNPKFDGADRWLIRIYGYEPAAMARARFKHGSDHVMLLDPAHYAAHPRPELRA